MRLSAARGTSAVVDDAVAFVAVLLWLTTAVESANVLRRRHPEPALNMLLLTFGLLATSATFFVPAVHLAVGRLTGVANIGEPIARTALLGAAWSVQIMLHRLGDHGTTGFRLGRRAVVLGACVVALWACYLAAPVDTPTVMFTRDYGHAPAAAAYLIVSLSYLWLALIDVTRGTMRYGRSAKRPLALALRLIGLGCWLGLGYIAVKVAFLVMLVTGRGTAEGGLESTISRLLAVGGGLLVITGSALPYLARHIDDARTWIVTYRNLRQLYPLWALMYRAEPGIALDPPGSRLADALQVRDLDLRLYRRVIEIRDGYLALAPYFPPKAGHHARSDDGQSEVRDLLVAVANKGEARIVNAEPKSAPASTAASLAEEVDHLARVARFLRTSAQRHLTVALPATVGENPPHQPTPRTTT